tara:strand:+ start:332 stop:1231 length:900 start_codon:yes stop_codon:yes gene_type:complete
MKKLFESWRRYTYLAEATQWTKYQRITDMLRGNVDAVDEISVLTPENPHAQPTPDFNAARTELFLGMLNNAGFGYRQIDGMYGGPETSYVIPHMSIEEAARFSYMFGQESFVYSVKQDAEEPMLHQLIMIDGYDSAQVDEQYDTGEYGDIYLVVDDVQHHVDVESNDLVEFGKLMDEKDFFSSIPDKHYIDTDTGEPVTKKGPRFKMDFYPDKPKDIVRGAPVSEPGSGPRYPRLEEGNYLFIDELEVPKTKESKKLLENIRKRAKLIKQKNRLGSSKYHHRKMIIQEKKKLLKIMEEK